MPEPVKVNVVSYGGVKPGQVVAGNTADGGKVVVFDASTSTSVDYLFSYCNRIAKWDIDMPMLKSAHYMFNYSSLREFKAALPRLDNGSGMFFHCELASFESDIPLLDNGSDMFAYCTSLREFSTNLGNLTKGNAMFVMCSSMESWNIDMPNLVNGTAMFTTCGKLNSFGADLRSLKTGNRMFENCSLFTSFNAGELGLQSLSSGTDMFIGCKLDPGSAKHVLETIPTYTTGTHALHLGKNSNFKDDTGVAALLGPGTPIPIPAGTYQVRGWTVTVTN